MYSDSCLIVRIFQELGTTAFSNYRLDLPGRCQTLFDQYLGLTRFAER